MQTNHLSQQRSRMTEGRVRHRGNVCGRVPLRRPSNGDPSWAGFRYCTRRFTILTFVGKFSSQWATARGRSPWQLWSVTFKQGRVLNSLSQSLLHDSHVSQSARRRARSMSPSSTRNHLRAYVTLTSPASWPVCGLHTDSWVFHKNALWCGK